MGNRLPGSNVHVVARTGACQCVLALARVGGGEDAATEGGGEEVAMGGGDGEDTAIGGGEGLVATAGGGEAAVSPQPSGVMAALYCMARRGRQSLGSAAKDL
jgi:hypothetical protein